MLSIGDEVLAGRIVDTNAAWISATLEAAGVTIATHRTVGDDREAIAGMLRELSHWYDVIVASGGLGPTADDLTRFAAADLLDHGVLVDDDEAMEAVVALCERRHLPASEARRMVAKRPPSAVFVPNDVGTAPGIRLAYSHTECWLLPGPPRELHPMVKGHVLPWIQRCGVIPRCTEEVLVAGQTEVQVATRLGEVLDRDHRPQVGIRVGGGLVRLAVSDVDGSAGDQGVASTAAMLRNQMDPWSLPAQCQSMSAAAGLALTEAGCTAATAESCTGGGIGAALTEVGGSSKWYVGGWVTYTNELKTRLLGVPESLLDATGPGAVSSEVVEAMAQGARQRSGADVGVAVSGIAGPDGGSAIKPVGTVWIAVADDRGVDVRCMLFPGSRDTVRSETVRSALQLLRWRVCGVTAMLCWERTS